ncbi:MAG: GAF domain-containing protein [Candidatus Sulfotelmatobacter sp.]
MAGETPTLRHGGHKGRTMTLVHDELLKEFRDFARSAPTDKSVMELICQRLHEKMTRYNWVGFYLVDPADSGILLVGPYAGSFTPNGRIPLSSGLCGAAASTRQTVVVHDVSKDPRYLAGSPLVKSEIVIPILARNKLVGELDIESYFTSAFAGAEQGFVEGCAGVVGGYLDRKG